MPGLSRRSLLKGTAVAAPLSLLPTTAALADPLTAPQNAIPDEGVEVHWLEGGTPAEWLGATWGVPWPKGVLPKDQTFAVLAPDGTSVPVQTWPTGYWPDGSLKWTAHAVAPGTAADRYHVKPGAPATGGPTVTVREERDAFVVDTGVIVCRVNKRGQVLIGSIARGGREIARDGELVSLRQDGLVDGEEGGARRERLSSAVDRVEVEQRGPLRAVLRITGNHRRERKGWLPFTIRLYLYAGSEGLRMMHTFVYDGDPARDVIAGLGVRFKVPMTDQPQDRHVRFAGAGDGVLGEAVRGITGLRRDPGAAARATQIAGKPTPDPSTWDTRVTSRIQYIPQWGDYTLRQLTADGFQIRKRTKAGFGWVGVDSGTRAAGLAYVGGISGGFAFGMRDFWQRHPTQLDIRGAAGDRAEVTIWLWSPDAPPMDLRFYHDGMGQDTYPKQLEGLEITYEDYEPGFGNPYGVARTTELMFWALPATPGADRVARLAAALRTPPQLVAPPAYLHSVGVFGDWSPVDRSNPAKAAIEDHLDFLFEFHRGQVEQRRWYGFWDYGDVMHTYDNDRHVWRYDIGGYAWDNSELSTDLWLWYHFLRTGKAEVFRFAEAMTRHTGEVDVYHIGKYQDLGTRHGVLHWADSAKQLRISTAAYRRIFYFLTADERVGDLMHDLVDADRTFLALDPIRKIRTGPYTPDPHALSIGFGTDWSALAAAWLTEWERGGDPIAKKKLVNTATTIAGQPYGFVQGDGLYDLDTGLFAIGAAKVSVSSLSAVFGLVEMCSEIIGLLDLPDFTKAWLQYCRLFNGTAAEQIAEVGVSFGSQNLHQAHARLTAYAAARTGDAALATRAWNEFYTGQAGYPRTQVWQASRVQGPNVLNPIDETSFVSTNASAQYGLAAIQLLALVGDHIPS